MPPLQGELFVGEGYHAFEVSGGLPSGESRAIIVKNLGGGANERTLEGI